MLYVGRTDHGAHRKKTRLTMVCSMVRPMEKTCPLEQTVVLQPVGPCCPPWYIQWHLRDPRPSPWCTMGHGMVYFMVPDGASVDTSSMGQPTKKKLSSCSPWSLTTRSTGNTMTYPREAPWSMSWGSSMNYPCTTQWVVPGRVSWGCCVVDHCMYLWLTMGSTMDWSLGRPSNVDHWVVYLGMFLSR